MPSLIPFVFDLDSQAVLTFTILQRDGSPYNLTGSTVTMRVEGLGSFACTITNAAGGIVTRTVVAGDFPIAARYKAQLRAVNGSTVFNSDIFFIQVAETVDTTATGPTPPALFPSAGGVLFGAGGGLAAQDATNFFWNDGADTLAIIGAITLTGTLTVTGNIFGTGYIDLPEISTPAAPASSHGRLYLSSSNGVTLPTHIGSSGRIIVLGRQMVPGTATTCIPTTGMLTMVGEVGTGANTTETDVINFSIPANTLNVTNDRIEVIWWFRTAANANTKKFKLYFGATTVWDSGAQAWNAQVVVFRAIIRRASSSSQKISYHYHRMTSAETAGVMLGSFGSAASEDLTAAVTLRLTMTNGTASANDCFTDVAHTLFYQS